MCGPYQLLDSRLQWFRVSPCLTNDQGNAQRCRCGRPSIWCAWPNRRDPRTAPHERSVGGPWQQRVASPQGLENYKSFGFQRMPRCLPRCRSCIAEASMKLRPGKILKVACPAGPPKLRQSGAPGSGRRAGNTRTNSPARSKHPVEATR